MGKLAAAGIPVGVMIAPVIPVLTDHELEDVLAAAANAGATFANYVVLRLPYEVKDLFREWLAVHEPLKADHVMSRLAELRGGRENDPRFGKRMAGTGIYADLLRQRFSAASRRLGFSRRGERPLPTHLFRPPALNDEDGATQLRLDW